MSAEFLEYWNQAKELEEKGHTYFQKGEEGDYQKAAEYHKEAANLFRRVIEFIAVDDYELRKKSLGNYHIERANYHHSLATFHFYKGEKNKALDQFQSAIEEQKKSLQEYEAIEDRTKVQQEILSLKIALHFYLASENLCSAQIAFLDENYTLAIEVFKIAEIHTNLEVEFISEAGDSERLRRANARVLYIKGQISRAMALQAMNAGNRNQAKACYLEAALFFKDATKLAPEWEEYAQLARKSKRMASVIKD